MGSQHFFLCATAKSLGEKKKNKQLLKMASRSLERDRKHIFLEIYKVWIFVAAPIPVGAS